MRLSHKRAAKKKQVQVVDATNTDGRMLPWHRLVLNDIWTKRRAVPSVISRRAWAAARNIKPIHVHNFFSSKKSKAKKKDDNVDVENEGYELDVEEGAMEEVIVKAEEEDSELLPLAINPANLNRIVRMPFTPRRTHDLTRFSISTSTPDLTSSNSVFPLTVAATSSPTFDKSFYSPPSLVVSSCSIGAYILDFSPKPHSRAKRRNSDAYNDFEWSPRKRIRAFDSNPSLTYRKSVKHHIPSSKQIKQDIMGCKVQEFLPPTLVDDSDTVSKEIKRETMEDDILELLPTSSPSLAVQSSPIPASSPLPPSSPVVISEGTDAQEPTAAASERRVHDKDDFCCFCGIDDINEVFLPQNRREGIWITRESNLLSLQNEAQQVAPFSTKLRPPHIYEGSYNTAAWESELYESIEWMEGGFDNFELSAIPRMAMLQSDSC